MESKRAAIRAARQAAGSSASANGAYGEGNLAVELAAEAVEADLALRVLGQAHVNPAAERFGRERRRRPRAGQVHVDAAAEGLRVNRAFRAVGGDVARECLEL